MPPAPTEGSCLFPAESIPRGGIYDGKAGIKQCIYFETPPYTGMPQGKRWNPRKDLAIYKQHLLFLSPVRQCSRKLRKNVERLTMLFADLMKIAERHALKVGCGALITGESLGQVASQTLEAINCTGSAVGIPVFRPCIGLDKEEIVTLSRKIDTFELSTLPYDDCCVLFTPRHPKLTPELSEVEDAESKLDVESLIEKALEQRTVKRIEGD